MLHGILDKTTDFESAGRGKIYGLFEVQTLLQLYESIFLRTLLFNCQSWTHLRKSNDIPSLERVQYKYLKQTMHVPYSTPNAGLLLEVGILPIKNVINEEKRVHKLCLEAQK